MHGDIGYKFCRLLPFEDHNQGTPVGHESNDTIVRDHSEDMNQLRHQLGMNQKSKLNYRDLFDRVWSLMKTRQDNNVIDRTSAVSSKTKLSYHH